MAVVLKVIYTFFSILTFFPLSTIQFLESSGDSNIRDLKFDSIICCQSRLDENLTCLWFDKDHSYTPTPGINADIIIISRLAWSYSSCMTDFRLGQHACRRAVFIVLCLLLAGDVESNPGPVQIDNQLIDRAATNVNKNLNMTFACLNARSIRSAEKVAVLHDVIADHAIDLICLTETWIKPDDPPAIANDPAPAGYGILHVT